MSALFLILNDDWLISTDSIADIIRLVFNPKVKNSCIGPLTPVGCINYIARIIGSVFKNNLKLSFEVGRSGEFGYFVSSRGCVIAGGAPCSTILNVKCIRNIALFIGKLQIKSYKVAAGNIIRIDRFEFELGLGGIFIFGTSGQ